MAATPVVVGQFLDEGVGEAAHGGFAGAVGGVTGHGVECEDRTGEDDVAG